MNKKELLEIIYRMEEQATVIQESIQDVKEKLLKDYGNKDIVVTGDWDGEKIWREKTAAEKLAEGFSDPFEKVETSGDNLAPGYKDSDL